MASQTRGFIVVTEGILAVFCFERVNVHRSIGRLRSNVFVERIPGNALDVMAMLGDLPDEGACRLSVSLWYVT